MDPVTIISGATVAFNALKKGFAIGKDLQDMSSQLTQWAGHMADLGQAEKQVKKAAKKVAEKATELVMERARDKNGHFISDDPDTEVNEAWVVKTKAKK